VKTCFSPARLAEKTRQSLAFSGKKATKPREAGEGFSLALQRLKAGFACLQTQTFPAKSRFLLLDD
jgi:hypothetical protein